MLIVATFLGTTLLLMLIGLPITFSIICGSILSLMFIGNIPLMVTPQNVFTGLDSFSLLVIPFFVLAGSLMTSCGITEKLLALANALIGRFRSGLADFVLEYIYDPLVFLIFLNILLLLVGMFIETNAAIVMLMPVFYPIAVSLGIDPVHFSVLMVVNLCIGLITPPAGLCLNIAAVLAKTSFEDSVKGVLPFLAMAIFVIAILTLFPSLVLVFV